MNVRSNIVILSMLMTLTACNGDKVVDSNTDNPSAQNKQASAEASNASDPVPQAGGYSNIDNAKLQELLDDGVLLVDIRRKEEWQQTGIVKGSKTITFFNETGNIDPNFVPEFTALAKPDQPVMLICRTGNRTQAASQAIAQQLGYKKVMNVTHGITGWIAEKRPVQSY
jgi:rhodanese-related sulfurtransferase